MSYTPTEWHDGDVVTAEKLNKLENGVVQSGCLVTNLSVEEGDNVIIYTLDKTAGEIIQHIPLVFMKLRDVNLEDETQYSDTYLMLSTYSEYDGYVFLIGDIEFTANELTDYPSFEDGK